jgi:hypothetical protein
MKKKIIMSRLEPLWTGILAGNSVIQASGRSEFEDGLGSGYSKRMSVHTMISIVYGSLIAGLPNNRDATSAAMADICAQYLRTGSTNYPPSPLSFSRVKLK